MQLALVAPLLPGGAVFFGEIGKLVAMSAQRWSPWVALAIVMVAGGLVQKVMAVVGAFSADAAEIPDGIIAYEWSGGCQIGEATIATTFRLESDFTAARTGDYDVSSVTPEEPIDAEGEVVDPETPDEGATVE